ncbi:hypothetical protein M4578_22325 [Salipiger sp. P9]|uniref:hypothetical protein n=1 Tax=Salipiger pentaromativorans TaxID=2943193 RepID=UPI0021572E89|nr:hypothetical protein [Salipiger pentaromativorans]MCR8550569.1 hypothetical protein [Salipiger pentaromativorans]
MTLWRALPLLFLAGVAWAAGAPDPTPEAEDDPGFASAAVGGEFDALPPSDRGYPLDLLARIRIKLGGEDPAAAAPADEPEARTNGH